MGEFVWKTRISTIQFEPFTFGITPLMQTFVYCFYDLFNQKFYPETFEREFLTLPDGGTLGFDWEGKRLDPAELSDKPILLMVPGVAGDSDNLYSIALMREIRTKFTVVILLLRGASGVPITSGKINHCGSWRDIKHATEYIYTSYVQAKGNVVPAKRTRLYLYGCSLGATMLGLYLAHEPKETKKMIDGACLYATIWDFKNGDEYFYNSYNGWPEWFISMNSVRLIRSH